MLIKWKNEIANAVNNVLKENKDATTVDPSKIGVLEQIRNAKGFTIDFGPAKLTPLSSRVEGYSNDYRQANTNNEVEGQSVEEAGSEIVRPFDFIKIEIPYTIKHSATGQEETTTLEVKVDRNEIPNYTGKDAVEKSRFSVTLNKQSEIVE